MHLDPVILVITIVLFFSMLMAYAAMRMKVPIVVAYILTGIIIGPSGFAVVEDHGLVTRIGEIGVIMLLFFVGMEVSIPRLMSGWKIAFVGTNIQILISVAVCVGLAMLVDMSWQQGVLYGFIISLSSTAVVLRMLQDSGELELPMGQNALGVLLVQDMAIIPMMIILSMLGGGDEITVSDIAFQVAGGIAILLFVFWLMRNNRFHIPDVMLGSFEHRMILGLLLCLGSASLTGWLGLSPALGAFLAGVLLASSDQSQWVHEHIAPVQVIFMAMFFLSVGMLVEIDYLLANIEIVLGLTLLVFLFNSGSNVFVMRALGETWESSLVTAGLLSQIGEFSFLLAAVGLHVALIDEALHTMTVLVIALTLMLSPLWHSLVKRFARMHGIYTKDRL
ncbi:monovalent cation:H+ antiporter-2, CPA2 family [Mariprofundus micogutta]|uniref:Monovalent cation:H+ antiporter-2, CPA2 family n=1 Tax=Mariprofundus micogutta TaxID=1921010 RepID=A0A1L8CP81_9PROT|nr:cation:proton antiporter [Mariprofundus micogutta]GAV20693.1 monovalent cation:H+ antiporter-2, CPA2 family [Mariprofundus micogutta]